MSQHVEFVHSLIFLSFITDIIVMVKYKVNTQMVVAVTVGNSGRQDVFFYFHGIGGWASTSFMGKSAAKSIDSHSVLAAKGFVKAN